MSYLLLYDKLNHLSSLLKDPNQDTKAIELKVKYIIEKIRAYSDGEIFIVKVVNREGKHGVVYLSNLRHTDLEHFVDNVLGFKYLSHESIPIGKMLILS